MRKLALPVSGLLALGLAACSDPDPSTKRHKIQDVVSMAEQLKYEQELLEVTVSRVDTEVRQSESLWVDVRIRNTGNQLLLVNRRMAPGYADSQARELYAVIYRLGTDVEEGRPTQLYERDWAGAEDYVELTPGDTLSTRFNLFEWYELPGPGEYELQVVYQADEPLSPRLEGLIEGVHASGRVRFTVTE